jgi:hypothetical protein
MADDFKIVLYDPFFDDTEEFAVEADDHEGACDIALAIAHDKGVEVEEVASPDGEISYFSTGLHYQVEAVTVIHTSEGRPRSEEIHALTLDMALDLAELMFGAGSVVSIEARGVSTNFNRSIGNEPLGSNE